MIFLSTHKYFQKCWKFEKKRVFGFFFLIDVPDDNLCSKLMLLLYFINCRYFSINQLKFVQ